MEINDEVRDLDDAIGTCQKMLDAIKQIKVRVNKKFGVLTGVAVLLFIGFILKSATGKSLESWRTAITSLIKRLRVMRYSEENSKEKQKAQEYCQSKLSSLIEGLGGIMDFCDGEAINEAINEGQVSLEDILTLKTIAHTLQHLLNRIQKALPLMIKKT
jgi:hypothetical protein